ncbi:hypothetical protein [Nocardia bovistercoris]|uniref:Uncharacterized protein n=1 Tax=Nocardia bovistercoris TaxID=2785916 RepID=A0A931IF09_9NOCA|nr:hypothetical protein [Nocardia bovistercoris]MBH0778503.1 hypothetical protein [Nocardia bovistercoris]
MTRFLAILSGGLLVLAVTVVFPLAGVGALALAVAGWWWRPCAVAAVLAALGVLVLADTGAVEAAAVGLVATTYLLNIAAVSAPVGVVPTTIPSVAGAVLSTACATGAALIPVRLAWAPLAAPVLVILAYALLARGLAVRRQPETAADG